MIDSRVRPVVLAWESFKDWLSTDFRLTHHELHVIAGLLIFVVSAKLMNRSLRSTVPLLPVLLLEAANETSDYVRYAIDQWPWTPRETLIDFAFTLVPPLVLILVLWAARIGRRRQ